MTVYYYYYYYYYRLLLLLLLLLLQLLLSHGKLIAFRLLEIANIAIRVTWIRPICRLPAKYTNMLFVCEYVNPTFANKLCQ